MAGFDKSIRLKILADTREYQQEMAKLPGVTQKQAAAAGLRMERELVRAQKASSKAATTAAKQSSSAWMASAKSMAGALAAIGVAKAAKEFAGLQQSIMDARNELTDAATRTGIAAETLNGLKLAAEGSGLEFSNLEGALGRFPKALGDTATGTGEAVDAFKALGIGVKNADGTLRDADTVFRETVAALGDVEDATTRAALTSDLFGRSGTKLLQALGDPKALDHFIVQANKFGIDVGPAAAKAAADWQREVATLQGVLAHTAGEFLDFGETGVEVMRNLGTGIIVASTLMKESFAVAIENVSFGFEGLGKLIEGDLDGAMETFAKGGGQHLIDGLVEAKQTALDAGFEFLQTTTAIDNMASAFTSSATPAIVQFNSAVKDNADALTEEQERLVELTEELETLKNKTLEMQAEDLKIFKIEQEIERAEIIKEELQALGKEAADVDNYLTELQKKRLDREEEIRDAEAETARQAKELQDKAAADNLALAEVRAETEIAFAQDMLTGVADILSTGFEDNKAAAIAAATINTLVAITKASTAAPPPLNIGIMAVAAAQGAVQVAKINSTSYHSGLAMAPDEIPATLTGRERVLTSRGAASVGGDQGVRDANRGRGGGGTLVVEQRYGHRGFDRFAQDNFARDATARRVMKDIAAKGGKVGHRG